MNPLVPANEPNVPSGSAVSVSATATCITDCWNVPISVISIKYLPVFLAGPNSLIKSKI